MGEPVTIKQDALRARAHGRIEQGLLPRVKATRTWGGRGSGLACSLCDAPISESEPEMELEFAEASQVVTVRFHLQCQSLWDAARRAPPADPWTAIEVSLPPLDQVVEARLRLGGARSVILTVTRSQGRDGADLWINATTQAPLPEGWRPFEWRDVVASVQSDSAHPAEHIESKSA